MSLIYTDFLCLPFEVDGDEGSEIIIGASYLL